MACSPRLGVLTQANNRFWLGGRSGLSFYCHLVEEVPFKAGVYRIPNGLMKETPSSPSISGSLFDAALPPVANQRRVEPQKVGAQVSTHMHINKHAFLAKAVGYWVPVGWGGGEGREVPGTEIVLRFSSADVGCVGQFPLQVGARSSRGVSTTLLRPQY